MCHGITLYLLFEWRIYSLLQLLYAVLKTFFSWQLWNRSAKTEKQQMFLNRVIERLSACAIGISASRTSKLSMQTTDLYELCNAVNHQLQATADLLPGKAPRYPLEGRLGESQGQSRHNSDEERNLVPVESLTTVAQLPVSLHTVPPESTHAIPNISSCLLCPKLKTEIYMTLIWTHKIWSKW